MADLKKDNARLVDGGIGFENEIYTKRFSAEEEKIREVVWRVLVKDFFQRFVKSDSTVLDIGAGDGCFLKNIQAGRKIAVDLSEHSHKLRSSGIELINVSASEFSKHVDASVDVIFMSNFLEHLPEKRLVIEVFQQCQKVLKPTGSLLILQPNIRYVGAAYWDYIDHHIALTEKSLVEALDVSGFRVKKLIPRFVPYTAKSFLGHMLQSGRLSWLVATYLKWPFLWRIFGQQSFVVAVKK